VRRLQFGQRVPGRPVLQVLWYDLGEMLSRLVLRVLYRFRIEGEELVPQSGPALYVSNHQSFLDPVINGCAVVDRQLTAIAREGLFRFPPLAWMMRSYGVISIKEDGHDATAIRAALAELAAGRCVLIYPEGSRSHDATVLPFQRGISLLIRRAKVPVVPMAIEGACDVWPRSRRLPGLRGRLAVKVGTPIAADDLLAGGPDAAIERLRHEIDDLRLQLRERIRRESGGRWPSAGPADHPLPRSGDDAAHAKTRRPKGVHG